MGTNFYYRMQNCTHCKRYNEVHVAKSSGTWQAYRHEPMDVDHPEWGYSPASPVGFAIMSREDWRRVFTEIPGELWNEYKEQIPDPLAWLEEQKPWKPTDNYAQKCLETDIRQGRGWLDADGFKFYDGEFW